MDRAFGPAAGAAVIFVLVASSAQAQNRLIAPIGPSAATQLGEATNAIAALNTSLVRGEPGRGGAGAMEVASRGTLEMTGLFEGLAPSEVSFSSQGGGDIVVTPWAELSAFQSEDQLRRYDAQVLELGVDAMLSNGLTIGAAVALVHADTEAVLDISDQTGEGEAGGLPHGACP